MLLALASVGKVGVCSACCLISMYFTELFPTVVRNMGMGITATASKIGTVVSPYVIYMGKFVFFLNLFDSLSFLGVFVWAAEIKLPLKSGSGQEL